MTYGQFLDLNRSQTVAPWARLTVAVLIGLSVTVTACFPHNVFGPIALVVAIACCVVVWWKYIRRAGRRLNDYDPMKSDVEQQRTATDWREEMRSLVMLIVIFPLMQVARFFSGPAVAIALFGFATAVTYWSLGRKQTRPAGFVWAEDITATHDPAEEMSTGSDALFTALYALNIAPGGVQILNTQLTEELNASLGWAHSDTAAALKELVARGDVATIRELRSRDSAVEWVTITPKGRHRFVTGLPDGVSASHG